MEDHCQCGIQTLAGARLQLNHWGGNESMEGGSGAIQCKDKFELDAMSVNGKRHNSR